MQTKWVGSRGRLQIILCFYLPFYFTAMGAPPRIPKLLRALLKTVLGGTPNASFHARFVAATALTFGLLTATQ